MLKYRKLDTIDLLNHPMDILKCYQDNRLIIDEQSILDLSTKDNLLEFLNGFIESKDSLIVGIFDQCENILFGVVIFDNIRIANKSCAEVHIAISRELWGTLSRKTFERMLKTCGFDTLYCQIPKIAVRAISMCKHLGFKKTGYIPDALPYTNANGESKMYDINFYTWRRVSNDTI